MVPWLDSSREKLFSFPADFGSPPSIFGMRIRSLSVGAKGPFPFGCGGTGGRHSPEDTNSIFSLLQETFIFCNIWLVWRVGFSALPKWGGGRGPPHEALCYYHTYVVAGLPGRYGYHLSLQQETFFRNIWLVSRCQSRNLVWRRLLRVAEGGTGGERLCS